ncbi:MAG: hypothetical protein O7C56_07980, partial [Rickettsia endosymbiont of Ixodes persulcatus]|nr:hypothetical protein [Rickettsia endosymbiont of Ixodes persulcatus]
MILLHRKIILCKKKKKPKHYQEFRTHLLPEQKSVKTNVDANREYVDALEKFTKEVGTDYIVSVTPSQLGLAKKA